MTKATTCTEPDAESGAVICPSESSGAPRPRFDGGPVPGGSTADRPVGFGQQVSLSPDVHGVALHAETGGDLDESYGVTVHVSDCTESLDTMQECMDNQYMTHTETTAHISGDRCPKTGRSASVCDSPDHRNCPDLRPAPLRYEDSKIVVAPIDHYAGPRLVRTTWFAWLALNKPGAQIQVRCPHGQVMARRLPGAPKGGGRA
jgi:hypothetical protein